MSRFQFHPTPLRGLMRVERKPLADARGFLSRLYCAEEFRNIGWHKPVDQINHTFTHAQGAVRGLHFQRQPYAENKLVSCIKGRIFDVAVDLRRGSSTFLHWHGEILSADNCTSLMIPEGFAHGFQALVGDCELIYLHTAPFKPEAEGALNVADTRLDIQWPLEVTELSDRDRAHPFLDDDFEGVDA